MNKTTVTIVKNITIPGRSCQLSKYLQLDMQLFSNNFLGMPILNFIKDSKLSIIKLKCKQVTTHTSLTRLYWKNVFPLVTLISYTVCNNFQVGKTLPHRFLTCWL